jgi:predicted aconitase with swiveling domain
MLSLSKHEVHGRPIEGSVSQWPHRRGRHTGRRALSAVINVPSSK